MTHMRACAIRPYRSALSGGMRIGPLDRVRSFVDFKLVISVNTSFSSSSIWRSSGLAAILAFRLQVASLIACRSRSRRRLILPLALESVERRDTLLFRNVHDQGCGIERHRGRQGLRANRPCHRPSALNPISWSAIASLGPMLKISSVDNR